jgi:hypothetical protein
MHQQTHATEMCSIIVGEEVLAAADVLLPVLDW